MGVREHIDGGLDPCARMERAQPFVATLNLLIGVSARREMVKRLGMTGGGPGVAARHPESDWVPCK